MSRAGTTFSAVAITCARIGLPPISCRTLGCFDLIRVPLPAAMIAMAMRGGRGVDWEDFGLVFIVFAMLRQYTVKANVEARLAASQQLLLINCGDSTPDRLPIRGLRHQRHQVVRDAVARVPRHLALLQIISQHRA